MDIKILTFTGHLVDLTTGPTEEQVNIEDIAHHLAFTCRYGGACNHFYSTAEHSIYVALMANKLHRVYYQLHDAAETWYQDLLKPLKNIIETKTDIYTNLTIQCEKTIFKAFDLSYDHYVNLHDDIKTIDKFVYSLERKRLFGRPLMLGLPDDHPLANAPFGMSPEMAEEEFLKMFNELKS